VHTAAGEWLLFDSCINPSDNKPAGLSYLEAIGVSVEDSVKLVVATHWDDDHIAGLARVVEKATSAIVACSGTLTDEDVLAFVYAQEGEETSPLGSGVDELRAILELRGREIVWAKENVPLCPHPPGDSPAVVALSPSEDAVARSVESLIEAATGKSVTLRRRYTASEGPNGASIACSVRGPDDRIILGADLVNGPNPAAGWDAVLSNAKPEGPAAVFKVPHHGSEGAHHDGVWEEMLADDPIAVLTPWTLAGNYLPLERDIERLKRFTDNVFLTAMPALKRVEKAAQVERLIRRLHGDQLETLTGWGHVRARKRVGDSWRVDLFGDACAA